MRVTLRLSCIALIGTMVAAIAPIHVRAQPAPASLYRDACANCHGLDGTGAAQTVVAFEEEVPDFTDCTFATREPDADWGAVIRGGGPVRAFSRMMPAFGEALSEDEVDAILEHVRTFCTNGAWPRGELNLPRPFSTEKAYPEDEAVWTTTVAAEGPAAVMNEVVYERRIGPRGQIEIKVPFGVMRREGTANGWVGGLGDIAFAYKRALVHGLGSGSIFSAAAELILPTGDAARGFGGDVTVFEPFLAFGQILPSDAFLHAQAGAELPLSSAAESEVFGRLAIGRTFTRGVWGRAWSPMLEILAASVLEDGADTAFDLVPQMQVTLNTRQHVMLNAGVRIPIDDPGRRTQILVYVLWDWFDGGLFDGW